MGLYKKEYTVSELNYEDFEIISFRKEGATKGRVNVSLKQGGHKPLCKNENYAVALIDDLYCGLPVCNSGERPKFFRDRKQAVIHANNVLLNRERVGQAETVQFNFSDTLCYFLNVRLNIKCGNANYVKECSVCQRVLMSGRYCVGLYQQRSSKKPSRLLGFCAPRNGIMCCDQKHEFPLLFDNVEGARALCFSLGTFEQMVGDEVGIVASDGQHKK